MDKDTTFHIETSCGMKQWPTKYRLINLTETKICGRGVAKHFFDSYECYVGAIISENLRGLRMPYFESEAIYIHTGQDIVDYLVNRRAREAENFSTRVEVLDWIKSHIEDIRTQDESISVYGDIRELEYYMDVTSSFLHVLDKICGADT